jgi:DNA-directed RNA polymerase specialized sigma24 family protein
MLTYWMDLPSEEVASLIGVTDGSVRRHLARARARLRKVLHEQSH